MTCPSPTCIYKKTLVFKNAHSSENDRQVSHGLCRSKLSLAAPCNHFDTYLTCRAQSGRKLKHVEVSTILPTPKVRNFRFGPTVRSVQLIHYRHERFTICHIIYRDQENINMLRSVNLSRRAKAFWRSLDSPSPRNQTIAGFFPYSSYVVFVIDFHLVHEWTTRVLLQTFRFDDRVHCK